MKKTVFLILFFILAFTVYAQAPRVYTVGIFPFEFSGSGTNTRDAEEATRLVIAELNSWGYMTILSGDQAEKGEFLVKGRLIRQNNQLVLTATTSEGSSGKLLNNSRQQGATLDDISIDTFCAQIAENIPFPNYLLGKWQSTINMIDGPVTCILEFRSDRTVQVEQFDTWEHNAPNSLKYQAFGSGTYTYAGYRRRNVNIGGTTIQADATIGVNLKLEDALPKYVSISAGSLRLLFNESRSNFELVYGGIPCGDNFSGASVYPGARVFYTRFSKIQ